jgi:hypothetical protein
MLINILVGSIIILIPIGIIGVGLYYLRELFGPIIILGYMVLWFTHEVGEFFIDKFKN